MKAHRGKILSGIAARRTSGIHERVDENRETGIAEYACTRVRQGFRQLPAPGLFPVIWGRLVRGSIRLIVMRDLAFGGRAGVCLLVMVTSLIPFGSGSAATVVLKDGAVIHGEIETLQDGVYTVETDSLGTVRVRKEDVRTIDHSRGPTMESSVGPSPSGSSPSPAELQALQSRLMQSPNLFSMIQALQSDPEVQAVLADPEVMSAMASGDYAKLMNHPKIIALTDNAKVREIVEEAR